MVGLVSDTGTSIHHAVVEIIEAASEPTSQAHGGDITKSSTQIDILVWLDSATLYLAPEVVEIIEASPASVHAGVVAVQLRGVVVDWSIACSATYSGCCAIVSWVITRRLGRIAIAGVLLLNLGVRLIVTVRC